MLFDILAFEVTIPVITLGAITGMTYGILAVGLVLIYRSSRIINFAHGEIGAFGAVLLGLAVVRWSVPYWVAFPLAIAISAGTGALTQVAVVRRLRKAPALMSIVATLGVAQFLLLGSFAVNSQIQAGARIYPQPVGFPTFGVGALNVTESYFAMLVLTPLVVAALVLFLRKSRFGLGVQASADNPDTARLAGVSDSRMSSLSWAIAGAVSAFAAILVFPTRGFVTADSLGPGLLMRALVGAVVARMDNLPLALGTGIAVGIVEQLLLWNYPRGGVVEMVLVVVILLGLLLQPRKEGRGEDTGSWATVQAWPPLPASLRKIRSIRNLGWKFAGGALLMAIALPAVITHSASITLVAIMALALVGLSLGIVTGLGGQLTLGQFALAGIGAAASYHLTSRTGSFLLGFAGAALAAALVSVAIGIPALRIRGPMLAVTTLAFALAAQSWLFQQSWMFGDGVDPGRPNIGNFAFDTGKRYYFYALFLLALGFLLARNLWRSGVARRLIAVRDNEEVARAFTVPATLVKLQGFAVAGFLAGLGGAVYGHALSRISAQSFLVGSSIELVAMTVLGGVGILAGPLIGALYIFGVPKFVELDSAGLAASSLGWLFLILYFPGGFAQLIRPLRNRVVKRLARREGLDPTDLGTKKSEASVSAALTSSLTATITPNVPREGLVLRGAGLRKYFGGIQAVDDISLEVMAGETLGLIGPNGAGKTTLFELLSGFTRPDEGRVVFDGKDVTFLGPEVRARLGLVRSFQVSSLFPTMTVEETIKLALERSAPTPLFRSLAGSRKGERLKEEQTRQVISVMGLDDFTDKQIAELSTGTRRITELACMIVLEPVVLLLDEPSAGISQRETEALGQLLSRVRQHLNTTLVIIEHDIPLIMSLADRLIAMESGRIIAEGTPQEVRHNPLVVESYLGGDLRAIERSGVLAAVVTSGDDQMDRCRAITGTGSRCVRRGTDNGYCFQHARAGRGSS